MTWYSLVLTYILSTVAYVGECRITGLTRTEELFLFIFMPVRKDTAERKPVTPKHGKFVPNSTSWSSFWDGIKI